jgi:hypothetical protein
MECPGLSPMHLISYLKTPIGYLQSNGREYVTVEGVGRMKEAFKGMGILYCSMQGNSSQEILNCQFDLQQITPAKYINDEAGKISLELEAQPRSPCSGIRTSTGEGYVISPAFKLDQTRGPNIVLMTLAPRTTPYNLTVEKSALTISKDEVEATVTSDGGELHCIGTISGQTKTAHLILNRNPELPVYPSGFNQTLSEIKGQGQISAIWKPVARSFEELIFAFYPSNIGVNALLPGTMNINATTIGSNALNPGAINLDAITNYLGAPGLGDPQEFDDYVIGDGPGANYALRLRIDRGLGRHDTDETRLTIT